MVVPSHGGGQQYAISACVHAYCHGAGSDSGILADGARNSSKCGY